MTQTIRAMFEKGVLKPLQPLDLRDRTEVVVHVESLPVAPGSAHPLDGFIGRISDEDAALMLKAHDDGCEQIDSQDPPRFG